MSCQYHVYILASKPNGTLYIGVTNNIARRVWEHKQRAGRGLHEEVRRAQAGRIARRLRDPRRPFREKNVSKSGIGRRRSSSSNRQTLEWKDLYGDGDVHATARRPGDGLRLAREWTLDSLACAGMTGSGIPPGASTRIRRHRAGTLEWIPAFAGMTGVRRNPMPK